MEGPRANPKRLAISPPKKSTALLPDLVGSALGDPPEKEGRERV